MFDENQPVTIKWSAHYSHKYKQFKKGSCITIPAKELSPYSGELVDVTCDYCGKKYKTRYSVATRNGKQACEKCAPAKANELRKERESKEKFKKLQEVCEKLQYTLVTKQDEYCGVHMNIVFVCHKHGMQTMMLENLIRGHECRICSYEKRGNEKKRTKQDVIECVESINNNKLLNPDDYKNMSCYNLNIQCSCGNVFTVSLASYIKMHIDRCPICSQKESRGELLIREYLANSGIEFEQEKRFADCRDSRPLPFDFYLPSYNMCIEFDGPQHFEPIFSKESLEKTQYHDKIKNEYCYNHNIKLLRIPYYNGSRIAAILDEYIA